MPKVTSRMGKRLISPRGSEDDPPRVATELNIDRATKRVIAPFVRIVRKGQKFHEVEEAKQFSVFLKRKPSILIRDLSSFLSDSVDLPSVLHETSDVLKIITKAAGVTLYMMDPATNEIYQSKKEDLIDRWKIRWKIREGSTVAAYVAYKKDYVMVDDIIQDGRFPDGIGYQSDQIKSVLCIPVVTPDGACFAVIELYKLLFEAPFCKDDLKITLILTGWMGAAIHQNSRRLALKRQQELNDYLLDLTKCFFGENVVTEKMISEIVKFARVTMNAERSSIFVIDSESGDEIVADLFEETEDGSSRKKVRFSKERGIAGLVARTGVTVNVKDAYEDTRFNKEIDQKTGFITRAILCMPIVGTNGILGVVQVINKRSGGNFNSTDETLFGTFCAYFALALRYSKVRKEMARTEKLNNCFVKIIKLQLKPCIHDLTDESEFTIPSEFDQFSWYIKDEDHPKMPKLCLYMFAELIPKDEIDVVQTLPYILSVQKFYRRNPYHNFEHAFNVCHCMYLLLKINKRLFTQLEIRALMMAALSHDLDHPGFTNGFLELVKDDLAHLYENNFLENHHYHIAMLILENYKIFPRISDEEYQLLRKEIKQAIIYSDMEYYFKNKWMLEKLDDLDWNNEEHRRAFKSIMITASDISGVFKPFLVSKRITDNLYAEFYKQGDLQKELGLCPLTSMDRNQMQFIPEDQINFMSFVVLPCLHLLQKFLPNTLIMYNDATQIMHTWQDMILVRGKKCWRQDDSLVEEHYNY